MAGTLTISTLSDGTNSTSSTNCIQGSAKAWVSASGNSPYTISASYNVSSVTNNGAGLYQINFTNAFADTKYAPVIWSSNTGAARRWPQFDGNNNSTAGTIATTNIQFYTGDGSTNSNVVYLWAAFFR
jgi:hypothetical protein